MNMRHELEILADTEDLKNKIFPTLVSLFTEESIERLSDDGREAIDRLAKAIQTEFDSLDNALVGVLMDDISYHCNLDQEKFSGRKGITYRTHEECALLECGHSRVGFRPHPSGKICVTYRAIAQAAHTVAASQILLAMQSDVYQPVSQQAI